MIRQKSVTVKTTITTLTLAEMGDVLCNSAEGFTLTLPAVSAGLWYRISNINAGAIVVSDGGTIATLAQYEQCLVLNNGTNWYAFEIHDVHNDLVGLQGGAANDYYHFTNAHHTDLTDAGDSALHYHAADRDRGNHTGTQPASTISDFDAEVSNNVDVAANTAVRHTRAHDANSADDHNAANVADYGKYLRANAITGAIEFGTLAGGGDMTKAVYDTNDDGIVGAADSANALVSIDAPTPVGADDGKYLKYVHATTEYVLDTPAGGGGGYLANASETLLNDVIETTIVTYTPGAQGNYTAYVYFRVITATTTITVKVTYTDSTGVQTNTLLDVQSCAVGSYSLIPVYINATVAAIAVKVTAGTANQVYVSASVRGG